MKGLTFLSWTNGRDWSIQRVRWEAFRHERVVVHYVEILRWVFFFRKSIFQWLISSLPVDRKGEIPELTPLLQIQDISSQKSSHSQGYNPIVNSFLFFSWNISEILICSTICSLPWNDAVFMMIKICQTQRIIINVFITQEQ